ncbi:MAG: hypothetical protein WC716_16645 [Chitinophagaceae bacterium]
MANEKEVEIIAPRPGFQLEAAISTADETLVGGIAGPGKTWVLCWNAIFDSSGNSYNKPIHLYKVKKYRALIFRRKLKDAEDLIDQCYELYSGFGAKWYGNPKYAYIFPSGARVTIGHMQNLDDWRNYRGKEIHFYSLDEAAEFEKNQFMGPLPWVRSTLVTPIDGKQVFIKPRIQLTCNWEGIGVDWLIERFRVNCPCPEHRGKNSKFIREETIHVDGKEYKTKKSFLFIPGNRENSVLLEKDPEYLARMALEMGGETAPRFRAIGLGCCKVTKGSLWPEANENIHLIPDNFMPQNMGWVSIGGYDYATSEWGDASAFVRLLVSQNFDVIVDYVWLGWGKTVENQAEDIWNEYSRCRTSYADRDVFASNQAGAVRTIADQFRVAKNAKDEPRPIVFLETSPDRKMIVGVIRSFLKATLEGRSGSIFIRERARRVLDDIIFMKADPEKSYEEWIDQRITIEHGGQKRQYHFDALMAFIHALSGTYRAEKLPEPKTELTGIRKKTMEKIEKNKRQEVYNCQYEM